MTAVCSLCHEIVTGRAAPVLDANRDALEWKALGERMTQHLIEWHEPEAAVLMAFAGIFAHWVISYLFTSSDARWATNQAHGSTILRGLLDAPEKALVIPAEPVSAAGEPVHRQSIRRRAGPNQG